VRPLLGPRQLLWLPDVLGPFARSFAQLAAAEGTRFEAQLDEDLPAVRASDIELRESISNLLDNALRYGDGLIALTLEPVDGRGSAHGGSGCEVETAAERPECAPIEAVRIAVWNSGEGLSDEALARAFEPGFRGARSHERPLAKGGSGLGLSIVLELISGLGGNVRLSNAPAPRWLAERNLERCHAGGALERGTLAEIVLPRASVERAPRGVQT
jgi:signal transduction histidine kinase